MIPVVQHLADALEAHRQHTGKLAASPSFQARNGKPLNLDNLVRRVIVPALSRCTVCRKQEDAHKPEGHIFQLDPALPRWHGWHAFRRGLATNLHVLGVDDKTIQAILRHSNIAITQNIYIKSVAELQVSAMDTLSENLGTCNDLFQIEVSNRRCLWNPKIDLKFSCAAFAKCRAPSLDLIRLHQQSSACSQPACIGYGHRKRRRTGSGHGRQQNRQANAQTMGETFRAPAGGWMAFVRHAENLWLDLR